MGRDTLTTVNYNRPIEILLVEDNEIDVRFTKRALKHGKVLNNLSIASDGEEAMDFLYQRNGFAESPRPDIILLDLNMPRKDGREVLTDIKTDESLMQIPVVVLTTSEAEQDVLSSYSLHANCYITKPVDFDKFVDVIRTLEDFWLAVVRLPTNE